MTAPSGAVDSGEEIFLAPRGVALRSAYGHPTRNAAGPLASPASYTTSWDAPMANYSSTPTFELLLHCHYTELPDICHDFLGS